MTLTNNQPTDMHPYGAIPEHFNADDLKWIIRMQNEERQSVGYQLRDSIGQVLTCCKLLLETKQTQSGETRILEMVNKHLQQTIGDIMHLSYQMTDNLKLEHTSTN